MEDLKYQLLEELFPPRPSVEFRVPSNNPVQTITDRTLVNATTNTM
jgi:hypothetical protein